MKTTKQKNPLIGKQYKAIKETFELLDFSIIYLPSHKSTNGPDLWVRKNESRPLSVEIKSARVLKRGCIQVDPVQKNRRNDDLIAIICNNYVLIESMADHLKSCSPKGTRQMTLLLGRNP